MTISGIETHDDRQALLAIWLAEAQSPFQGWDFSHISGTGRMRTAPTTWCFASEVLPRLRRATSLLDMGTGGGELLSQLRPLPARSSATEGYAPNLPLARARLEPLGVKVVAVEDDVSLPFADGEFDLIINRHESYAPAEVWRVLAPGGLFITQQVGGEDGWDLNMLLGARFNLDANWRLVTARGQLEAAGFEVLKAKEDFPRARFFDVGAIVYYLKAVPWQIEDFTVARYAEALFQLHQRIEEEGYLDVRDHRFFLAARKMDVRREE